MTSTNYGASSVIRPENLAKDKDKRIIVVCKLINKIISNKYSHITDKRGDMKKTDLFNEGYLAALDYLNKYPEKSVVALLYKRIDGALADYFNRNSATVKITKNKDSKRALYKKDDISDENSTEGELFVRNAKQNVDISDLSDEILSDESMQHQELLENEEKTVFFDQLYGDIINEVENNFSLRDKKIFEMRVLQKKKLKEVSKIMNFSLQRVNKIEKNIFGSLKFKFGNKFNSVICDN